MYIYLYITLILRQELTIMILIVRFEHNVGERFYYLSNIHHLYFVEKVIAVAISIA